VDDNKTMGKRIEANISAEVFWNNYQSILNKKGEKEYLLLEKVNIPRSTIAHARQRNSFPNIIHIHTLAKALSVPMEAFFRSPEENHGKIAIIHPDEIGPNQFRVPLLNQKISAGHGMPLEEYEKEQALIPAPTWLSRFGHNIAALQVVGDSMEPTLFNNDYVICDTLGWDHEGIYALHLSDQIIIKRLQKLPKTYRIISDNPRYPIIEEPIESEDIRIIGLLRCVIRMI